MTQVSISVRGAKMLNHDIAAVLPTRDLDRYRPRRRLHLPHKHAA